MHRKHLDPSLTQTEKCLLRRAEALEDRAGKADGDARTDVLLLVASEFRALAGELHEL